MKALQKDFFRELKRNKGRFISVFFIVLLGSAFFSGLRSSKHDMLLTAEQYYDKTDLMDMRVVGSLGLTDDDLNDIAQVEGVESAYGGYTTDVLCDNKGQKTVRLIAYMNNINLPTVVEGRLPENETECFVDAAFLAKTDYKVGDTISFESGNDESLDNTLCCTTFTIVGSGNLPFYTDLNRGTSTVGDGKLQGFVLIEPEAFKSDCYTEICIRIAGAETLDSFEDEYQQKCDDVKNKIEDISRDACQRRYNSVYSDANSKITDAKQELSDANLELEDAKNKIADGEKQIADAENAISQKQDTIDKGYAALEEKKTSLDTARQKYSTEYNTFSKNKTTLEQKQQQAKDARAKLEASRAQYNQAKAAYDAMLKQAGSVNTLPPDGQNLKASIDRFEQNEQKVIAAENEISGYAQQISAAEAKLAAADKQIKDGEAQLSSAKSELDEGSRKLTEAKDELNTKKQDLEQAKADYEKAKQESEPKLADAQQKISDSEDELSKLSVPEWFVLDRNTISSYVGYESDSDRIANIAKVFPVIFFLVAALVALTAMTRMVEEQRQQVGTLKALGSGNGSIMVRYLLYSLIPTVSGAFIGVLIGEKVLPLAIMSTYSILYTGITEYVLPYNWTQGLIAILASSLCTLLATLFACYKIVREKPTQIMRPEAPKTGKRVLLERISFIWKRLSFTQKSTIRNLFRYKKRFFMTLFGVAGCMGLVLVGLGLHDSIMVVCDKQFSEITHYNAAVSLDTDNNSDVDRLADNIALKDSGITISPAYQKTVEIVNNSSTHDVTLQVMKTTDNINDFFTFRVRGQNTPVNYPQNGAIISEKTATSLGVKKGDTIEIKIADTSRVSVQIEGIYENYIGHYLFISSDTYNELYGNAPEYNQLLLHYNNDSDDYESELGSYLLQQEDVKSVSFVSQTVKWADDTLSSLTTIVYIVLFSAGLLAFVVIYNLNSINIAERQRELGTLKVLGFYDSEVASYVYRENILLCILGIIFGMFVGVVLHQYVIRSVEVDMIMFGRTISTGSFAIGALLTLTFSIIINLAMYKSIKKIDMIESLKSIE